MDEITTARQIFEDIEPQYIAQHLESSMRALWEKSTAFHADCSSKKPAYSITMPPPNVTGVLHMGHALVNTLQDILIRWKKMSGYEVLWMPGTDHAGIATQTVVERNLMRTEGKRRTEYSREEFLQKVWEWKEKSQETILGQLRALGCACDWKRLRFTMDEGANVAVRHMFKLLFDKGLIYRGDYLVHWDPVSGTALADDEVEYEERSGCLYTIRYPLADSDVALFVATTRPETLLGDTAVAVHPKDERYKDYVGRMIHHPITGRMIPIVADDFVEREFGTGVVKITPGHDPNDYQLALRHNLPMINILNKNGTLNEHGLKYQRLTVEEARAKIVKDLRDEGLLTSQVAHTHRVGVSYRSKAVIEPMLSKQWFVRMSDFKQLLRKQVEDDVVRLVPAAWKATYFQWIDNLRDWCVSRQLWWGHRIPVWYNKQDRGVVICYDGDGLPPAVEKSPDDWEQDPDVLDTWFSSALWPFSTLGWPKKTVELDRFYPNATLITGHDILFFWVARMILMGNIALGKQPFQETFLHGLIYGKSYWRDTPDGGGIRYVSENERKGFDLGTMEVPKDVKSRWEKMSKSKGNVLDPIEVMSEYGTDAMRLALTSCATDARQIDLDRRRFDEWRHFANKVWNGARYMLMNISREDLDHMAFGEHEAPKLEDRWIRSRLARTCQNVEKSLEKYAFDKAAQEAYDFYWNDFCAYYIELIKPSLLGKTSRAVTSMKQVTGLSVLIDALSLLHPFAPYITEVLFQKIKKRYAPWVERRSEVRSQELKNILEILTKDVFAEVAFPRRGEDLSDEVEVQFSKVQEVITKVRAIRGEMKIPPSQAIELYIQIPPQVSQDHFQRLLCENLHMLQALIRFQSLQIIHEDRAFVVESRAVVDTIELIVPLPKELLQHEYQRLEKEIAKLTEQKERTALQLANEKFIEKAPAHLVEQLRQTLKRQEQEIAVMQSHREELFSGKDC